MKQDTESTVLKLLKLVIYPCLCSVILVEGIILKERKRELKLNKRLEDHMFRTLRLVSLEDCFGECEIRPRCVSINYQRLSLTCELNKQGISSIVESKTRNGFVFLEKEPQTSNEQCGIETCTGNQACDVTSSTCVFEECGSIQAPVRGSIYGNRLSRGSKLSFRCLSNYVIKSNDVYYLTLTSECLETGGWSFDNFDCVLETCKVRRERDPSLLPGLFRYTDPGTDEHFDIYCDFRDGFGYTFISKSDFGKLSNLTYHYTRTDYVIIRHIRQDGIQRDAEVSVLPAYSDLYNLTILLNEFTDFKSPRQISLMPYILVGFVPNSHGPKRNQRHGYECNNDELSYINCDSNDANYFAVFSGTTSLAMGQVGRTVGYAWVYKALPIDSEYYLPTDFFGLFEIGMGGCGAFITNHYNDGVGTALGAAIGMRFDL